MGILINNIYSSTSPHFLEEIFQQHKQNPTVVKAIITNNCCPTPVLWESYRNGDESVALTLAERAVGPFGGIILTPEDEVYVSNRNPTPEELLDELACNENIDIVSRVAYNINISEDTMFKLVSHTSENVLMQLAKNQNINDSVANMILESEFYNVKLALAVNDNISVEFFQKILSTYQTDTTMLKKLLTTSYYKVLKEKKGASSEGEHGLWGKLWREVSERLMASNIECDRTIPFYIIPNDIIERFYNTTESVSLKRELAMSFNAPISMVKQILSDVLKGNLEIIQKDSLISGIYTLFKGHTETFDYNGWAKALELYEIIMNSDEKVLSQIVEEAGLTSDAGIKDTVAIILRRIMLENPQCPKDFIIQAYHEIKNNTLPSQLTSSFLFRKNPLFFISSSLNAPTEILEEIEANTNPNKETKGSPERILAEKIIHNLATNRQTPYHVLINENFVKKIPNNNEIAYYVSHYISMLENKPEYKTLDMKKLIYVSPQIILESILERANSPYNKLGLEEPEIVYLRLAAGI